MTKQAAQKSHQPQAHTRFLSAVESRGFFFLWALLVQTANNRLWQLLLSLCCLGWPWRRRKAKKARVGCRLLPELIYSLEFHNFNIIDTESCTNFSLRYALIGLLALQILNSAHKVIYGQQTFSIVYIQIATCMSKMSKEILYQHLDDCSDSFLYSMEKKSLICRAWLYWSWFFVVVCANSILWILSGIELFGFFQTNLLS